MTQAIVFKNEEGGISVIHPAPKVLAQRSIQAIARKDVPPGKPYAIVPLNEMPEDRTFRDAWSIEDGELVDGVGNDTNRWDGE